MGIRKLYQVCLSLYPAEFREEYGRELSLTFMDRWREERSARTVLEALGGILREAPKEHLHVIGNDLRYALRILRKDRAVTLAALAILALGIGSTTLVFSLADGLLLRPMPYADPGRIVEVEEYSPTDPHQYGQISMPTFADYAAQARLVEACGLYGEGEATLRGDGVAETIRAAFVSDGVFRVLGVTPLLGRVFTREETAPNGPVTLILSEELWTRRYGRDPRIVGRSIPFGDGWSTVVGVMPASFHFPENAEMWVPEQRDMEKERRSSLGSQAIARLKPGVTSAQASAESEAILEQILRDEPNATRYKARVTPLREFEAQDYRKQVIALLVAVGLLLAIACANVSNLLLVKASARGREMAMRLALGASRHRLVRQLASESLLLGLAGGLLGVGLAYLGLPVLLALIPADLPRWMHFELDGRVLLFSVAISLLTSLVFGMAPAIGSSGVDLTTAIKNAGRSGSSSARYKLLRSALVVGEVALSVVLLAGAGLTVRSFLALRSQNLGYRPDHVLSMGVMYPTQRYTAGPKAQDMIRRLTGEIARLPGVQAVAVTGSVPLSDSWNRIYEVEGRPLPPKIMLHVNRVLVGPGYFGTLGIALLEGRDFTEADFDNAHVVVVTRTFARINWPNESAIGKHVRFGPPNANEPWNTIIGVVADNRHEFLKEGGQPVAYLGYSAEGVPSKLLVRTSGDPAGMISAIRALVRAFDRDMGVYKAITLPQLIERASWQDRFLAALFLGFAVLALTLAAVGLYGALSYAVSMQSREIGIRMALGASAASVKAMLLREGMTLAGGGLAIGMACALALTRLLESQLFGVSPRDPVTYVLTPLVLLVVSMAAVYAPARRATRVDPAIVLRCG